MSEKLIPLATVLERSGHRSVTTLWRERRANRFPEPVSISPNRKAWRESDIDSWIAAKFPNDKAAQSTADNDFDLFKKGLPIITTEEKHPGKTKRDEPA